MKLKIKIPFLKALENIKHLEANLIKCAQDIYNENSKTLPREIKDKVETYHIHGLEASVLLRCQLPSVWSIYLTSS